MQASCQLLFQNNFEGMSDEECYAHELRLAERTEELGFSGIWCVEHHFDAAYSMCPDNMQLLTWLAARTSTIELTTGAIILPWNAQPLRVAEKLVMLDHMSGGRVHLGLGRGLSRQEYAGFGIAMEEARDRFDEAADIILRALDTGVASASGNTYYNQPDAVLAPAPNPQRSWRDRLTVIAMSPDSLEVAARLGARMATFIQFPIERHMPGIDGYRDAFRATHGHEAPPPVLTEFVYCHEDSEEAARVAREHLAKYYTQILRHYELGGDHFAGTKGYEAYEQIAEVIRAAGHDEASAAYAEAQTWGTPDEIVEKIRRRREIVGDYHLNCAFSFAGLAYDKVQASMELFGREVIPRLATIEETAGVGAAG